MGLRVAADAMEGKKVPASQTLHYESDVPSKSEESNEEKTVSPSPAAAKLQYVDADTQSDVDNEEYEVVIPAKVIPPTPSLKPSPPAAESAEPSQQATPATDE